MSHAIRKEALRALVGSWLAEGKRVAGPVAVGPGRVLYQPLVSPERLLLDGFIRTVNSIKAFVFPRHEELYAYRFRGRQVELIDAPLPEEEQIVIGARPCDAAALPVLDHVFRWGTPDRSYERRRELTTVVTLACREYDDHCFCTSLDSGPRDERGSDVLLVEIDEETYEVVWLTSKGKDLFVRHTERADRKGTIGTGPKRKFDAAALERFLAENFESPVWETFALRCLGCGACAYDCRTCHCFDIVDEGDRHGGMRVRNWDSCQFALFTLHASGHNPRTAQAQRIRQRIYHKFRIYPDKFGDTLCTGCGNCSRGCPVHLGIRPVLEAISALERKPQSAPPKTP